MAHAKDLQTVFERTAQALSLKPAVGQGTDVTTVRLDDGTTCHIEDGPWTLTADVGEELGGHNAGPAPGVFGRAALGSCIAITAALWAAKLGVPITALEVEVESDHDARGIFGVGDVAAGWSGLRYRATVESPAPEADVRRVLEKAHRHSQMRDSFGRPLAVEADVQVVAPTA